MKTPTTVTKNKLIPGQALIYEQVNGVTYARYRDPPHNRIPRWEIGRVTNGTGLDYSDFNHMQDLAKTHLGFRDAWENMLTMYYLVKDLDNQDS